jgi:DNA-binding GntR family transcriptional regulator
MADTQGELKPVEVPNVSDVIFDQLRQHIVHGKFSPGDQLNLNQLEEQLNVSRTPLKTALVRLESEGLVIIHARKGTFIAQLGASDIQECFEVRMALEAQAIRHAFEEHNQARISQLIELLAEMDNYLSDSESWLDEIVAYMDIDRQVHTSIIELSGNQRMKDFYEQVNMQGFITIMRTRFTFEDTQEAKAEHREIQQALEKRDRKLLKEAVYTHLKNGSHRAILRLSKKDNAGE